MLCPRHPAGSPCELGASSPHGSCCCLGPSEVPCSGAEQRGGRGAGAAAGPELPLPAPVVQQRLGSVGEFTSLISERHELSRTPRKVPMRQGEIRVWLHNRPWERRGPVLVPAEGVEAASPAQPLPFCPDHQGHGTQQLCQAWRGHSTQPVLWRKEFVFNNNNKKPQTLNMFFKEEKD